MTARQLAISRETVDGIIAHSREQSPIEACGYLAAANGVVMRFFPLTNVDGARDHFAMDPAEQFAVVRQCREQGLQLRAVYHSHPETPARPSVEDIRLAHDPEISYVIISLEDGGAVIRSFRIRGGQVRAEEIIIAEASSVMA